MEGEDWKGCSFVSIDAEVMHGEPVFRGTRMPVEEVIESYDAYREMEGVSDDEAISAILNSFRIIPGREALRDVLAYEAAHEHQLQP